MNFTNIQLNILFIINHKISVPSFLIFTLSSISTCIIPILYIYVHIKYWLIDVIAPGAQSSHMFVVRWRAYKKSRLPSIFIRCPLQWSWGGEGIRLLCNDYYPGKVTPQQPKCITMPGNVATLSILSFYYLIQNKCIGCSESLPRILFSFNY